MHIISDTDLPDAEQIFGQLGRVTLIPGRLMRPEDLKDADILLVRSVTRIDSALLAQAGRLKFVGTATAGIDHVDTQCLRRRGIAFASAPGNNSASVGDYVLSVLLVLRQRYGYDYTRMSLGIIGCGHVGSQVAKRAGALGLQVLKYDPPRLKAGDRSCAARLEDVLSCDIVTLHVPLTREGDDRTFHFMDEARLAALRPGTVLINAARGAVIDSKALLKLLCGGRDLRVWLDVYEGEPEILCRDLLEHLEGCTAHIAGYAFEAKYRAMAMLAQAVSGSLGLPAAVCPAPPAAQIREMQLGAVRSEWPDLLTSVMAAVYDVRRDVALFRRCFNDGSSFMRLRAGYPERRETASLCLCAVPEPLRAGFAACGFRLED